MSNTEQEAIERAWRSYVKSTGITSEFYPVQRSAFTAGYLAHKREVAEEREHLEEAARHRYNRMIRNPNWVWGAEDKAWLARELVRRSKQEAGGT